MENTDNNKELKEQINRAFLSVSKTMFFWEIFVVLALVLLYSYNWFYLNYEEFNAYFINYDDLIITPFFVYVSYHLLFLLLTGIWGLVPFNNTKIFTTFISLVGSVMVVNYLPPSEVHKVFCSSIFAMVTFLIWNINNTINTWREVRKLDNFDDKDVDYLMKKFRNNLYDDSNSI